MALPKSLARIEEKLDRVLAILEEPPAATQPKALNPDALAEYLDWDSHNAKELIARIPSLTPEQRAAIVVYEQAHANRKTVIEAVNA